MKLSPESEAQLANFAKELGLPETNEVGHSWSCHCEPCLELESKRSGRILKAFGLPTHKENGHTFGCGCEACQALSDQKSEEISRKHEARERPTTIAGMLMGQIRKNREH